MCGSSGKLIGNKYVKRWHRDVRGLCEDRITIIAFIISVIPILINADFFVYFSFNAAICNPGTGMSGVYAKTESPFVVSENWLEPAKIYNSDSDEIVKGGAALPVRYGDLSSVVTPAHVASANAVPCRVPPACR